MEWSESMDWKEWFDPIILERGYHIDEDSIRNYKNVNKTLQAKIKGTHIYDVHVDLNGPDFSAECTCPYAKGTRLCKHMAALAYYYERLSDNKIRARLFASMEELEAKDLIQMIKDLIESKPSIARQLLDHQIIRNKLGYNTYLNDMIDNFLNNISSDFGDYYGGYEEEYFDEEQEGFSDEFKDLIKDGEYDKAYTAAKYLLEKVHEFQQYRGSGDFSFLIEEINIVLKLVLKYSDPSTHFDLLMLFIDVFNGFDTIEFNDLLIDYFHDPKSKALKIVWLSDKLDTFNQDDYLYTELLIILLDEMKGEDYHTDKRAERIRKNWIHDEIRDYAIDEWIENKDYDRAIEILKHNILLSETLSEKDNIKLKNCYLANGDHVNYVRQMKSMLTETSNPNLQILSEYKNLLSESAWIIERGQLFNEMRPDVCMAELYEFEDMHEELMAFVEQSLDIEVLRKFEKSLIDTHEQRLLSMYEKLIPALEKVVRNHNKVFNTVEIIKQVILNYNDKERAILIASKKGFLNYLGF